MGSEKKPLGYNVPLGAPFGKRDKNRNLNSPARNRRGGPGSSLGHLANRLVQGYENLAPPVSRKAWLSCRIHVDPAKENSQGRKKGNRSLGGRGQEKGDFGKESRGKK